MSRTVQIQSRPEKVKEIIEEVSKIIKDVASFAPIIGERKDAKDIVFIIYEGVFNYQDVALTAMGKGAIFTSFM